MSQVDHEELERIKKLISETPNQNFLDKGNFDTLPFKLYSQLPEVPDRERWWYDVRRAIGLSLVLWRDLSIQVQNTIHQNQVALELIVRQIERMGEEEEMQSNVEEARMQTTIHREVQPTEFPKSTWDPFIEGIE